jgi:hypothetical protein
MKIVKIAREVAFWIFLAFMAFTINACFNTSNEKPSRNNEIIETEQEELDRLQRERLEEDEKVYGELGIYNGTYGIITESEGVYATLEVEYNNDKTFTFTWLFTAADTCEAKYSGLFFMDQTQHGFYVDGECTLHFNFMGNWGDGDIIEIEYDGRCEGLKGECIFIGKYLKSN